MRVCPHMDSDVGKKKDRRLSLLIMIRSVRRPKRSLPPEEFASSGSVDFTAIARDKSGRLTKKRVVEKTKFDTRPAFNNTLETSSLLLPSNTDPPEATVDASTEVKAGTVSRAVSVSVVFSCHVTI